MGSLESGLPLKRTPLLRSSPSSGSRSFFHRPRSRLARFLLFEKVDYLQWICTAAAFFFVVILFQAFLPGSVVEKSGSSASERGYGGELDRGLLREFGDLDFGEGIRFVPSRLLERFEKERREANLSSLALGRPVRRMALRKPKLALVVGSLFPDAMQLEMISIAAALKEIGYDIQVYSLKDGPMYSAWRTLGMPISILPTAMNQECIVDWLDYNGIFASSLEARPVFSCLLQEPFKSVPVIWSIHEKSLALRLHKYAKNGQNQLINDWKQVFNRATVVVFPTHLLPIMYSSFDAGNYFVIPSSADAWTADNSFASHSGRDLRIKMGYESDDFLIAIVGSQFSYSGMWLEHALVLQALAPVLQEFPSENTSYPLLKFGILSGNSTNTYKMALETIVLKFGYPRSSVEQIAVNGDEDNFLCIADLVIYGSFLEEQSFPPVLLQAMSLGKPIIAPDLDMIRKYVDDKVNVYLYPKENLRMLTEILLRAISNGRLSLEAQKISSAAKGHARNLLVSETIHGYASLLESVLGFPSEFASPKAVSDIPSRLIKEWQWHLFKNITDTNNRSRTLGIYVVLDKLEEQWSRSRMEDSASKSSGVDEAFSPIDWGEEKKIATLNSRKRLEEQELKDRTDQPHGTWEDVYRSVKRADRAKNELHERDDRELERTGQPLCIYEPYFGEGTWPFLHSASLYRGIGLSSKGRRPGADDIDASSRLPLLSNAYYRDALGEYGAFFALANRIDRIHKNAWIGFQSWKAATRKECLSKKAETALLEAIQAQKHGDTLYFWARMDRDPRNPSGQDFWSFCDAINAGNCRFAVSVALRRMYGVKLQHGQDSLPQMPKDGDSWSVLHSWALPTRSFLEFVMFSRMFVDALDTQFYDEHHRSGYCYLSLSKDRHCYSRVLELLVNVWAYHSARQMVYVNPQTGAMQIQHKLRSRKGHMWIKWFSFTMLKSMDEDHAEEADSDRPDRRWLWPSTGEVFWQGIYERERSMRHQQKERRKQQSKDKIQRIRKRAHQKTLGKYIKPPPDATVVLNTTRTR